MDSRERGPSCPDLKRDSTLRQKVSIITPEGSGIDEAKAPEGSGIYESKASERSGIDEVRAIFNSLNNWLMTLRLAMKVYRP